MKDQTVVKGLLDPINKESVLFGATTSLEGKQIFRQYDWFDQNTFLDYLKQIHRKFPKCYLFLDKAKQHYRSKKILQYFTDNKDNLIPIYIFQQHHWNLWYWKRYVTYSQERSSCLTILYSSFTDFLIRISTYFRTKRFNLNMRNYLLAKIDN